MEKYDRDLCDRGSNSNNDEIFEKLIWELGMMSSIYINIDNEINEDVSNSSSFPSSLPVSNFSCLSSPLLYSSSIFRSYPSYFNTPKLIHTKFSLLSSVLFCKFNRIIKLLELLKKTGEKI
jgi:hypothetical protein